MIVIGFAALCVYSFIATNRTDKFGVATITLFDSGSKSNKITYKFTADGAIQEDWHKTKSVFGLEPGDRFIIGYEASNPKNNSVIYKMKFIDSLQVDSLNRCCTPSDFISWWDN